MTKPVLPSLLIAGLALTLVSGCASKYKNLGYYPVENPQVVEVSAASAAEQPSAGSAKKEPATSQSQEPDATPSVNRYVSPANTENHSNYRPVKVVALGYGSESTYEGYTLGQQRLMAIRASKLDAYRSLAEQIYGIQINGSTTISAMMAKSDGLRTRVDAVLRGARIVSITPMSDGNYETVVEVYFDPQFYQDVFVYSRASEKSFDNSSWMR
jgi:hypothetical protein